MLTHAVPLPPIDRPGLRFRPCAWQCARYMHACMYTYAISMYVICMYAWRTGPWWHSTSSILVVLTFHPSRGLSEKVLALVWQRLMSQRRQSGAGWCSSFNQSINQSIKQSFICPFIYLFSLPEKMCFRILFESVFSDRMLSRGTGGKLFHAAGPCTDSNTLLSGWCVHLWWLDASTQCRP